MPTIRAIPTDPLAHLSIIVSQLTLGYWNEVCFVHGERVRAAVTPALVVDGFGAGCKRWMDASEALGMLPFLGDVDGVLFRSNYDVLHTIPFNVTASELLLRNYPRPPARMGQVVARKLASGEVETKCLEYRHAIAILDGLDMVRTVHKRLYERLDPLASVVADYDANHSGTAQHRQMWFLLKTHPLKDRPVPREEFEAILDDAVSRVRMATGGGGSGSGLHVSYYTPTGDADVQFVLGASQLRVQAVHFQRVSKSDLHSALNNVW